MKKRVDIEVEISTLAQAASEATRLGITRRKYLSLCVEVEINRKLQNPNITVESLLTIKDGYNAPKEWNFLSRPTGRIIPNKLA